MQKIGLAFLFLLHAAGVWAQDQQPTPEGIRRQLHIRKASASIRIDGIPDEAAWADASAAEGFYNNFPDDTSKAKSQTEVRVAYDDWDNLWYSETHRFDTYWCVEMAIPFRTIRFKPNISHWGINFTRNDLKRNESSTWSRVPRIFNIVTVLIYV